MSGARATLLARKKKRADNLSNITLRGEVDESKRIGTSQGTQLDLVPSVSRVNDANSDMEIDDVLPTIENLDINVESAMLGQQPVGAPEAETDAQIIEDPRSIAERRTRRLLRLPERFRDVVAAPLSELPPEGHDTVDDELGPPSAGHAPRTLNAPAILNSPKNVFGLFRRFFGSRPAHDPEEHLDLQGLAELPIRPAGSDHETIPAVESDQGAIDAGEAPYPTSSSLHPFPNENSLKIGHWFINGGPRKSLDSLKKLVKIIGNDDFRPADVRDTQWEKSFKILGANSFDSERLRDNNPLQGIDGDADWKKSPINIQVPFHSRDNNPGPKDFHAGDLYHRSLVEVIKEKLANTSDNKHFHYQPYELYWEPMPDIEAPIRVHGELYTSPAFVEAHNALQDAPGEPGCSLPRVVTALMLDSDATHLTTSGDAKLWPCYLWFGNESKYRRSKPTNKLCNHVAYFQTLPDRFKDFATEHCGDRGPSKKLLTHCRRELFHAQWEILLDAEFLEAYEHGIVVTTRKNIDRLGTPEDVRVRSERARVDDLVQRRKVEKARNYIFKKHLAISSKKVEDELKEISLTPTDNAFSKRLAPLGLGFNLYLALVVDLMHEFELGVWKSLFMHILRILEAHAKKEGTNVTNMLDARYRQVPSFGRDTIRRFSNNVSELKQLAARDYEDLLQCAIPVLDGLLPEPYNTEILTLLFVCSHWHALAKLRMHTDCTLDMLDEETTNLGTCLRSFAANTCEAYITHELPRETAARNRRKAKNGAKTAAPSIANPSSKLKTYNLRTIKHHFLGDYARTIRMFGTTDSYTTEPGELEHKTPKQRYVRTSGKEFVKQMAGLERRETRIQRIYEKLYPQGKKLAEEPFAHNPNEHHHIGTSENHPIDIGPFLRDNAGDPAIKRFWFQLKSNLMPRILDKLKATPGFDASGLPSPEECDADQVIIFKNPRFYQHQILHINYTSYDVRRLQDIINARSSHNNIMVLSGSGDNASPRFRYGRVLGTYHVKAIYVGPGKQNYDSHHLEFLWVRWYDQVGHAGTGWNHKRLDRLRFAPINQDDSFGIIDPSIVLRGCHIIPRFTMGPKYSEPLQGLSHLANDSADWLEYYVNYFVDRDMVMRYHFGHGVGHVYSHGSMPDYSRKRQDMSSSHEHGPSAANLDGTEPDHTSFPPADGPEGSIDGDSDVEDSEFGSEASLSDPSGDESDSESGDYLAMSGNIDFGDTELEELAAEAMYYDN
ncbi:hypothetical protein HWV62_33264 [Athelia sp. TMB]|nr:hypothetical protein HWV62_33264 [Athelia sp. TMB]